MKKIIAFAGSNNPNSINHRLVMAATHTMPVGCVTVLNLTDFSVPMYSEELERQSGIPSKILDLYSLFKDADGFLIASPEHNGLPPAFFKNIIDWLSRIEMKFLGDKPVMLVSTSHGDTGGQSNLGVLSSLLPRWGASAVISYSLGNFGEYFDSKENKITNENERQKFTAAVYKFLNTVCAEFSPAHPQTIHQFRETNLMKKFKLLPLICLLLTTYIMAQHSEDVGRSPWGPNDEIGTLNMMTEQTSLNTLSKIRSGKVYDLSVEYFVGMPSFHVLGDPGYQYWLTHTPHGTIVDNPNGLGEKMNSKVSYTGDAISMYTHMGTHIDALNHFGLNGKIWNGFTPEQYLGDKGWKKTGAEKIPPIVARGVLIDVAAYKGVEVLSNNYRIMANDLKGALAKQKVNVRQGDVVVIRTGQAQYYENADTYLHQYPGIALDAVRWLVKEKGVMLLGADNLSFEAFPPERDDNWVPVHTYLLAEQGVMFIEQMYLEELAKDKVYEFAFIASSLKLRGASASPMRPIALPYHKQ